MTDQKTIIEMTEAQEAAILTDEQKAQLDAGEDIQLTEAQTLELINWKDDDYVEDGWFILPEETDLKDIVVHAYDLSSPEGFGKTKYTPGELPEDEAEQIVKRFSPEASVALDIKDLNGRKVSLIVKRNPSGALTMRTVWPDHTKAEFRRLLQRLKVKNVSIERDLQAEEETKLARAANPTATQESEDE